MTKRISILGSTGSIGRQALEVVRLLRGEVSVLGLAAGRNRELLARQITEFHPAVVSLAEEDDALWLRDNLPRNTRVQVFCGEEGMVRVATHEEVDMVLTAVSGAAGLIPTVAAIRAGKDIALANKETMVAAGPLVVGLAGEYGVRIIPVDSEHSAIWQCLHGEDVRDVEKIILTASGGPFRNFSREEMAAVTVREALAHPNWSMGPKITIDSATLMNKGLEVIEARWLFGIDYDRIEVLLHPQSIIHSMVEFVDGSILAQLGLPDMRLPIQYAFTYPHRKKSGLPRLKRSLDTLTFEEPDEERFPALKLAYRAGRVGGTMPAVLNAANEVAVHAFLKEKIRFLDITDVVERVMSEHVPTPEPSLEHILEADRWARKRAESIIETGTFS